MRLVFERDIPEYKGKTRRERNVLHRQARNLDKRIMFLEAISGVGTFVPLLSSLMELRKHGYLPSLLWVFFLYLAIGIPLGFFLRAWWVNPLVKDAIQSLRAEGPKGGSPR